MSSGAVPAGRGLVVAGRPVVVGFARGLGLGRVRLLVMGEERCRAALGRRGGLALGGRSLGL